MSLRKLPRWVRKLNVVYQLTLIGLTGLNGLFAVLEANDEFEIPKTYYQLASVALAALPVVWSKFLDSMKEYQNDLTPNSSLEASPPASLPASLHDGVEERPSSAP